jgi:hypothetical protein
MLKNIETEKALALVRESLSAVGSPDEGPLTERMRLWWTNGVFVSLREPGARAFRDLSTLIEKRARIDDKRWARDVFSRKYIEDKVQELIGETVLRAAESDVEAGELAMSLIGEVWKRWLTGWSMPSDLITHYTLVQNLVLSEPLQIGSVTLAPWDENGRELPIGNSHVLALFDTLPPETIEELRDWVADDFPAQPGNALARASIGGAEPVRARELFRDRVRETLHTLSFLRRFVWPVGGSVILDLRGTVPTGGEAILTITEDQRWGASYQRATLPFILGPDRLAMMNAIGLPSLSAMLSKTEEERTGLEASCINAVTWLSRGLQDNVADSRLLKLCIGMESLLLTRTDELKGSTIADRVAFLLAEAPKARKAVAKQIRQIYDVRSDVAHEGRSSRLAEQLGPAQFYTTEAVLQFIRRMREEGWRSKEDFIRWCNDFKWA